LTATSYPPRIRLLFFIIYFTNSLIQYTKACLMSEKDHSEKDENGPENQAGKGADVVEKKEKKRIRVELDVKGNEEHPQKNNRPRQLEGNTFVPFDQKSINFEDMLGHTTVFPVPVATMADVHAAILAAPVGVVPAALIGINAALAANTAALAALAGVPAALVGINAAVAANTAALAGVPAALAVLRTNVEGLRDDIALVNNRGCGGSDHPLLARVIPGAGPLPAGFPATVRNLTAMTGLQVDVFLNHWQIAHGGATVRVRRHRLGTFLGIPSNYL
jgi:hypothetical protein